MLVIRLMRTGKIHAPHYRVVVQEKRSKLNGKAVDTIGHYHPAQADKLLVLNKERAQYWLSKGAQPSDTVTNLFVKDGILGKESKIKTFYTAVKKEEKPAAPKAEAAPTEETPAEEVAETTEETPEETPAETPTEPTEEVAEETSEPAEPAAEEAPSEEPAPEADTAA